MILSPCCKLVQNTHQSIVFASLSRLQKNSHKNVCNCKENNNNDRSEKDKVVLPEPPQDCCMSGCANCVWVTYAEELVKILKDNGETAVQKIREHVKDPNLRTFILLEIDHLFKKK